MSTDPHEQEPRTLGYCSKLLAETREEVARADTKASILLGLAGVVATVYIGLTVDNSSLGSPPRWTGTLILVGGILYLMGIACLALAIFPRSTAKRNDLPFFFGDVAAYPDEASLSIVVEQAASQPLARALNQLLVVSKIVVRKYRQVQYGMVLLGCGSLVSLIGAAFVWRLK